MGTPGAEFRRLFRMDRENCCPGETGSPVGQHEPDAPARANSVPVLAGASGLCSVSGSRSGPASSRPASPRQPAPSLQVPEPELLLHQALRILLPIDLDVG